MCLIIDRPESVQVDDSLISRAMAQNAHGWGIMRADNGKIIVKKGFGEKSFRKAYRKIGKGACVIHYRFATHGATNLENCHPFAFGNGHYALMHNGMIETAPDHNAAYSDTWHFTHDVVEPMLAHNPDLFGTARFDNILSSLIGIGNKLVILRADGAKMTINADCGLHHDGLWLSNSWSLPRKETPKASTTTAVAWKAAWERHEAKERVVSTSIHDARDADFIDDTLGDDERYQAYLDEKYAKPISTLELSECDVTCLDDLRGYSCEEIEDLCVEDPAWIASMIWKAV